MWYAIIRSPETVRSYFSVSSTRPRFLVALSNGVWNPKAERLVFLLSYEEDSSSSSLVPNFDMALPYVTINGLTGPCPSLHGFLTLPTSGQLIICNPSTEQIVNLYDQAKYVGYDPIDDPMNPGIVCFHVRSEKLSYIKAHPHIVGDPAESTFIEYKGKLASIVPHKTPAAPLFHRFDLWILEDIEKHEWSKKTCVIPHSLWNSVGGFQMSFPGTNKAGEIIMAPTKLSRDVRPFYIFYYNVETRKTRRVRLQGVGDNQEFRRSYGFKHDECHVRISPQHIESIAFFKNPTT